MIDFADAVGFVGVFFSASSYMRLQMRREFAKTMAYSFMNVAACTCFGISIFFHWNLASFVNTSIWLMFSLYGVYRCMKYKWRERAVRRISD